MKFSIGYNYDIKLLKLLEAYKDNIEAFYFPIPNQYLGSGRSILQKNSYVNEIPELIKKCNLLGIKSQLLLNATCAGESGLNRNFLERLVSYIKKLRDIGLGSVVITNPAYISRIKKATSGIRIESSVNCYVKTAEHALYLKDLGVDVLTIDRDINRNIPLIKEIKKKTNLKIKLMLNEGCLSNCPFRVTHYNYLSHYNEVSKKLIDDISLNRLCTEIYLRNPAKVFGIPFIPPNAIRYYESFIDYYKLSTRAFSTQRIELCLKAYINQQFDGNLLEILDSPGLAYFEYIDYNTLSKSNFFKKMISCADDCNSCSYCNTLLKEATIVNTDFLKKGNNKEERKTIRIYKNILKASSNKDSDFIYKRLSKAYFNLGEYKEAIKKIRRARGLNYKENGLHFFMGLCYERTGEYKKAIQEFRAEEKINPQDIRITLSLARCYKNTGQRGLVNKEIDRCIRRLKITR